MEVSSLLKFRRDGLQIQISCQSEEFTDDRGLVPVGEVKGRAERNGSVRRAQAAGSQREDFKA